MFNVQPDIGDKDARCPMHLAAAEVGSALALAKFSDILMDIGLWHLWHLQAWILATSYLLGISGNPNMKGT